MTPNVLDRENERDRRARLRGGREEADLGRPAQELRQIDLVLGSADVDDTGRVQVATIIMGTLGLEPRTSAV